MNRLGGPPSTTEKGNRSAGAARARPTHFLSLPLYNHADLRDRVAAFQNALFAGPPAPPGASALSTGRGKRPLKVSSIVEGLDSSIVIDPRRLHMTLGVMALQPEHTQAPKTVASALTLLRSLQPQISAILAGSNGVQVPLEVLDVFNTTRIKAQKPRPDTRIVAPRDNTSEPGLGTGEIQDEPEGEAGNLEKVGAGVLFVGPKHVELADETDERRKLREISELVHRTFRDAEYITDKRPLQLHCTLLNASHRRPSRRAPFAYTDILAASSACALLDATDPRPALADEPLESAPVVVDISSPNSERLSAPALGSEKARPRYPPPPRVPPPRAIALGTYRVGEVQLWVMGSRGPDNEYVSCGGVRLK